MFKLSIIIVHWNTPELLERLLVLIGKNPSNHGFEVIVVDNNSKFSPQSLARKYDQVKFIFKKSNHGFGMAGNIGVTQARGEWLLFLNPDVIISNSQLKEFIQEMEGKNLDAGSPLSSKDLRKNNNYHKSLPSFANLLVEFSPLNRLINLESSRKTLTGGCLMIKNLVFQQLGGWDERFFLWFEDSDLSARLYEGQYKVGWIDLDVVHLGGRSLKKISAQKQKDIFFMSMKVYAQKYFNKSEQFYLSLLTKRFSKRKTLPAIEDGVALVVPNMKISLLKSFLVDNWKIFEKKIKNGELNLIVVSSDMNSKSFWQFKAEFPEIRFILIKKNFGFASTVNIGWRSSIKKWLGTVNDDTIIDGFWIDESMKYLSEKIGSINPLILGKNGEIESAGIDVLPIGKAIPITSVPDLHFYQTTATNGAGVIYSHQALEKVGLFDERFGSYLEDIDLSLRLKKHGFLNTVITSAQIIHKKHASSKKMGKYKKWLDFKNWWLVIIKNWPLKWWIKFSIPIIVERSRNFWGIFKK